MKRQSIFQVKGPFMTFLSAALTTMSNEYYQLLRHILQKLLPRRQPRATLSSLLKRFQTDKLDTIKQDCLILEVE